MTLDLGFSCFFLDVPEHLQVLYPHKTKLQMTLVDCPGHASLIRTIIGGAQIIDMVLLVVDAYKGWQAQTTECLVLAELTSPHLVVALNKIDMFPENEREEKIKISKEKVRERLKYSRFPNAPMVGVSACIGGEKVAAVVSTTTTTTSSSDSTNKDKDNKISSTTATSAAPADNNIKTATANATYNIDVLIDTLQKSFPAPKRNLHLPSSTTNSSSSSSEKDKKDTPTVPFYFSIDHCFPIKGMGTVLTGTVLNGTIKVNEMIEFPTLGLERKVKSMQMFKRKTTQIQQGDRAGICVSSLDSTLLERGIAATPKTVQLLRGAICLIRKIPYYNGQLLDKTKFHISVGHTTIMATVTFFGAKELYMKLQSKMKKEQQQQQVDDDNGQDSSTTASTTPGLDGSALGGDADRAGLPYLDFDWNEDFLQQSDGYLEELSISNDNNDGVVVGEEKQKQQQQQQKKKRNNKKPLLHWAVLDFQTPVYCPLHSLIIGSRLDAAIDASTGGTTTTTGGASSGAGNANSNEPMADAASSCRLAFCGRLIEKVNPKDGDMQRIRLYNPKQRLGVISRLGEPHRRQDDGKIVRYEVYGSELLKKETIIKPFIGMKLITEKTKDIGILKGAFGTAGKFRVHFPAGTEAREGETLILPFKRFLYDAEKKMRQEDIVIPAARPGSRIDNNSNSKTGGGGGGGKKKNANPKPKPEAYGTVDKVKGDVVETAKTTNNKKKRYETAIVAGFFTPEINIRDKIGQKVRIATTNEIGYIAGPFGKAGKCKVSFVVPTPAADATSSGKTTVVSGGISENAVGAKAELYSEKIQDI